MNSNLIFISAGEASGDLHAAHLIEKLKQANPELRFMGLGGQRMREQGCEIVIDNRKMAVIGLWEIVKHLPDILAAAMTIKDAIRRYRPATIVLIDYPGFNLRLAKFCKKLGMRVIYYIPPQLWAWHESRIKKIKKYVNTVAVIYPFEVEFYKKHGVQAYYVGNPLLDKVQPKLSRLEWCEQNLLNPAAPIIGLAPGSRLGEIERVFETLLQSAEILQKSNTQIQFVLPLAPSLKIEDLKPFLEKYPAVNLKIVKENHLDLFFNCDLILAVSGTVTVEIALAKTPCLVIYKVSPLTYWIGKKLVKIKYMSLTNLILDRRVLPEFMQEDAQPGKIAAEAEHLLTDMLAHGKVLEGLIEFREQLEKAEKTDIVSIIINNI